jgi:hypothetical protein
MEWRMIRRSISLLVLAFASVAAPCLAQSAFDGHWKIDATATHQSGDRFSILLEDGTFTCRWCSPVWSVPADGEFHVVKDQPQYDEVAVQIIEPSAAVFTRRKNGRTIYQAVDTVSHDGALLSFAYMEIGDTGKVETGTGLWRRVSPQPEGSHPVSGEWRELQVKATSEDEATFTIASTGDTMRISLAPGETVVAKINGPAEPVMGDTRGTSASLRLMEEKRLVQTEYRNGEIVSVTRFTLLDTETMELVVEYARSKSTSHYRARKFGSVSPVAP